MAVPRPNNKSKENNKQIRNLGRCRVSSSPIHTGSSESKKSSKEGGDDSEDDSESDHTNKRSKSKPKSIKESLVEGWSKQYGRAISTDEVEEINLNLSRFFKLMLVVEKDIKNKDVRDAA